MYSIQEIHFFFFFDISLQNKLLDLNYVFRAQYTIFKNGGT